jgi:hypothetical protein
MLRFRRRNHAVEYGVICSLAVLLMHEIIVRVIGAPSNPLSGGIAFLCGLSVTYTIMNCLGGE